MKKLLLIALVAVGFVFVSVQRSDAQIYVGIPGVVGVRVGYPSYGYYYGYPRYYGYYPYNYYGTILTDHTTTLGHSTTGPTGIEFLSPPSPSSSSLLLQLLN
jgi:hypothetical protein